MAVTGISMHQILQICQTAATWRGACNAADSVCFSPVRISKDRSTLQVLNKETGAWFWACHDNFHMTLAKAACKQMGYSRYLPSISLPLHSGFLVIPFPPSLSLVWSLLSL